ncbi:hypothetical protein DSOUD_0881 [Desulfuromonas soudanensis]|uniref:Uncharacterized protein n=1 Tax=Desulfuromonas soudanensis TaxID=1603606 RepID=A0A0M5IYL6_9BACT|nr:hypothetical protein [Desulfuromonas soudanensis]ALC15668.1 hypothetical protein DSOUD_0881 [Desulfuromonas soudanensis]
MWPGYIEDMKTVSTVVVAVIALVALMRNSANFERNIRNGKIESIYTIVEELATYYFGPYGVYLDLIQYHRVDFSTVERSAALKTYMESAKSLRENYDIKDIQSKLRDLEILSRAYLKKPLCMRVMAFQRMVGQATQCALGMDKILLDMFWAGGFPEPTKASRYADDLANSLIDEIGLSSAQKGFREKLEAYTEEQFKPSLR